MKKTAQMRQTLNDIRDAWRMTGAVGVVCVLALLIAAMPAFAQVMPGADVSSQDAGSAEGTILAQPEIPGATLQSDTNANAPRTTNSSSSASEFGAQSSLTANQIITLLHQKPEAMVDVKQVMAGFFLKEGIAVQADSITDEILFSNIAQNVRLQQAVSTWLRARGYAPDEEFERQGEDLSGVEEAMRASQAENAQGGEPSEALPNDSELAMALRNLPLDSEVLPQDDSELLQQGQQREAMNNERLSQQARSNGTPSSDLRQMGRPAQPNMRQMTPNEGSETRRKKQEDLEKVDVLHVDAPYNLEALRDLYTQVPEQRAELKRFGSDVFLSRGLATREMPIDLPIGPDYVLGPGDGLTISLWGGVTQSFSRVVDREGRVMLPEAGSVVLAGLTLERAQALVEGALTPQFKDAHVTVSVSRLRTVRVYVVGDVQRPGAYDISSLSTPLNALYAAGGPTAAGSLRTVRHMRGGTLVREVDLYDFLLHGVRLDVERLEPGDTILVPAAGPQVTVEGMVKRPAIYEFKSADLKLSEVLADAGGLRVTAALPHIRVERVEADGHRTTVEVGIEEGSSLESARAKLESFQIKDGDRVVVAPVLPYSESAVYLTGHVVRPGKVPYRDGMKLTDAVRSYQDLLPEPAERGEIIRLMPPDLHPVAMEFSVPEALAGNDPITLQPFDTIVVRGRYEDDAPKVTVRGEVLHPGAYALAGGMTAAQLVRIAGGFKRDALLADADLASYEVKDGREVVSERRTLAIGDAVNGNEATADVALKPGDVLTVHQVSGWNDIGASVTLAGEVTYPGTYGLQTGERLSSVLKRAGGFRGTAYPDGAVLVRRQVKDLEDKSRLQLIRQMETTPVGGKLGLASTGNGDDAATLQLLVQQQNQVLMQLRSQSSVGRLVIRVGPDIASWAGTPADVEMRAGDVLTVPKQPGFVLVSGQVYNPSAITYTPGKDAGWYLRRAGGVTEFSNRKDIFVVRANGLVVGHGSGEWYHDDVLSTKLYPGDVVVVPQKIVGGSALWKNMLATAQVVSSIAFTAALALQ